MENQVSNSGAIGEHVNLKGKYVAGRDIKITETKIFRSKPEFSEVDLQPYNSKKYLSPKFTNTLLDKVKEKGVIIVGGSYGFDKGAFVRHLAALLTEQVPGVVAKEWLYSSDYYTVFSLMQEEKSKSIFILNQILPQHVNYNIAKLVSIAGERSHLILISTDSPIEAWKLSKEVNDEYWFEIPSDDLYDDTLLTDLLCKRLNSIKEKFRVTEDFNRKSELTFMLPVKDVAIKLKLPHKIELFHKLIVQESSVLSKELIEQKLLSITIGSDIETLNQWFQTLEQNEKIIALGVLLFDGLYDDQFFGALANVVNDFWYLHDNKLKAIDYCDLESVLSFYKLEAIDENKKVLKSKFPNQRLALLKTVWHSHRRHLITALPTLVRLVHKSVYLSHSNLELFGTNARKENLHTAVSEILSDMGSISLASVETILIELASDDNIEIQAVAAKAIARWHENGKSETLFAVLDNWQKETRVQNIFTDILQKKKDKDDKNKEEPGRESSQETKNLIKVSSRSYIRAAIALTLGYASKYDSPGNLSAEITELLKQLCKDPDRLIRQRLIEVTLPQVISLHFMQLKDFLFELTEYPDLIHAIARGLANAYNSYPDDVLSLLFEWTTHCTKNSDSITNAETYSETDRLIVTILMTLGEIDYSEADTIFNLEKGFQEIIEMQKKFSQKKFRQIFVIIVKQQIRRNFKKYLPNSITLVENFSFNEQDQITDLLLEIYKNQREELRYGEDIMVADSRYYPVWIENSRPVTNIENSLFDLIGSNSQTAQQIAAKAFVKFTNYFDYQESIVIKKIKEQSKPTPQTTYTTGVPQNFEKIVKPTLFAKWALNLVSLPKNSTVKSVVSNISPVLLKNINGQEQIDVLEKNWNNKGGEFKLIGTSLKKVFEKYLSVKSVVKIITIVSIIIILIILFASMYRSTHEY